MQHSLYVQASFSAKLVIMPKILLVKNILIQYDTQWIMMKTVAI